MSAERTIEQRLAAAEQAIAELQRRLDEIAPPKTWGELLASPPEGGVPLEVYDDMMALVQEAREAERRAEGVDREP